MHFKTTDISMEKKKPEITKELLTQSALNVLSSTSYKGAKLEDIARDVGLTRGAIYWHFENKLALYRHILKEAFFYSMKDLFIMLDSGMNAIEKMESVMNYLLSDKLVIHCKSALIYNSLLMEKPEGLESDIEEVEGWFASLFEKTTASLREGVMTGIVKHSIHPELEARAFYNFLWGFFTNRERFFIDYEISSIKEMVKEKFIRPLTQK